MALNIFIFCATFTTIHFQNFPITPNLNSVPNKQPLPLSSFEGRMTDISISVCPTPFLTALYILLGSSLFYTVYHLNWRAVLVFRREGPKHHPQPWYSLEVGPWPTSGQWDPLILRKRGRVTSSMAYTDIYPILHDPLVQQDIPPSRGGVSVASNLEGPL